MTCEEKIDCKEKLQIEIADNLKLARSMERYANIFLKHARRYRDIIRDLERQQYNLWTAAESNDNTPF